MIAQTHCLPAFVKNQVAAAEVSEEAAEVSEEAAEEVAEEAAAIVIAQAAVAVVFKTLAILMAFMKKYFYHLIYGVVIIVYLAMIFGFSRQIKIGLFSSNLAQAQIGGSGSGIGTGSGIGIGQGQNDSKYNIDYCGSCKGLYCYNGPADFICKQETQIKAGQQIIISLIDQVLYYRNRILAEKADLFLEIAHLNEVIDYYQKKINAENKVMQQFQEQNAKALEQMMISVLQGEQGKTERNRTTKQEVIKHFDELAKPNGLIDQLAAEIPKASSQIDKCFIRGVNECKPSCSGGCHDTLGCKAKDCSGGTPSACSLDNTGAIQNLKSKIDSEIQSILSILGGGTGGTTPTTRPSAPWP